MRLFGTPPGCYNYQGLVWFLAVYLGTFLLAGLLAAPAYWLVEGLAGYSGSDSVWAYLASKPFDRYVDRLRLLATAGAVLWLIRYCGLWGRFGFDWSQRGQRQFVWALLAGIAMLLCMLPLQLLWLDVTFAFPAEARGLLAQVLGAVAGALLLSWLEESIFRGMLLRIFYTAFPPLLAVLLSAFVFAIVHFKSVPWDREADVTVLAGLGIAAQGVVSFVYTFDFFHFTNLFLAGILLNLVFLRTGNLSACLGLHAGWVIVRNLWGDWAEVEASALTFWLGSRGVVDGVVPIFLLLVAVGLVLRYVPAASHKTGS